MSDFVIKSTLKEYSVNFVTDYSAPLKKFVDEGAFIICDQIVFELYQEKILPFVTDDRCLVIEASENTKTLDKCKEIIEFLVEKRFRRNQKLIALGGGVIQDVTAFIASILYRGVGWIFFPTTLLAQGDSCIGSKTSINLGNNKNLLGNFYPPDSIYIDSAFLETLEVDDIKSGIGEMLHFYYYAGSQLIPKLIDQYSRVISDRSLLREFTRESLCIKKSVIEIDEFDRGERNKFNYGHTFGHALETITGYAVRHGQAVTVGMDLANYLSWQLGLMTHEHFVDLHGQLAVNFPNYDLLSCSMDDYFTALSKDKKNIGNNLGCILAKGSGCLERQQLPFDDRLKQLIRTYFKEYWSNPQ